MKLAYEAFDQSGTAVKDVIDADSPAAATQILHTRGLFVAKIKPAEDVGPVKSSTRRAGFKFGKAKHLKQLAMFTRQLHVLVATGTPLAQAIIAQNKQTRDPAWHAVIEQIHRDVEQGRSLSEAMAQHGERFDVVYRSLIAAGESTGNLAAMLERLAKLVQKQAVTRGAIISSLTYPLLLICVSGGVLLTLFLFVLPRFRDMFEQLDAPLPPTTMMLMVLSDGLRYYWWALLLGVVGSLFGLYHYLRSEHGRKMIDLMSLRLPILGPMTRSFTTARIARLLGVLIESGVPLLDALRLIRKGMRNRHYEDLMRRAEENVTQGEPVSRAFEDPALIDSSVHEALKHGEESGSVGMLALTLAEFLDEQNDQTVRSISSIIEPVILLVLGVIVAGVALSIFMPLFDLTSMTGAGGGH